MDFASLMSGEISKAKAKDEQSKKFLKRAEVEAEREAKYLAEQRASQAEKEAKLAQKRKREEDELEAKQVREEKRAKLAEESQRKREERELQEEQARRKRLGLPELAKETSEEAAPESDNIEDGELVEMLRALGYPAKLFGETHKQRLQRFKKLSVVMTTGPIPTSLELVEEKDMKVETVPKDEEGRKFLFRQLASYFTMVLKEWEEALEKEKRDTFASKAAYSAMVQSKESMTPVSYYSCIICGISSQSVPV
jgi:pre-mRNA-splicing factor 18